MGMNRYSQEDREFDEALLEHYDDLGDHASYNTVLNRMRQNNHEPEGPGRPLPNSVYYRRREDYDQWDQ